MKIKRIAEAIETGVLYAKDFTDDSAYVYYEPNGVEHEHAVHYVKIYGVWIVANEIHGDMLGALGGDEAEDLMLELLGLINDK